MNWVKATQIFTEYVLCVKIPSILSYTSFRLIQEKKLYVRL